MTGPIARICWINQTLRSVASLDAAGCTLYVMLLKLLFVAIVLYYVVKTFRSLIRAISSDGEPSRLRNDRGPRSGRRESGSSEAYEDVEDAKYVDI